jgi:hypothetical protein
MCLGLVEKGSEKWESVSRTVSTVCHDLSLHNLFLPDMVQWQPQKNSLEVRMIQHITPQYNRSCGAHSTKKH